MLPALGIGPREDIGRNLVTGCNRSEAPSHVCKALFAAWNHCCYLSGSNLLLAAEATCHAAFKEVLW